jgi:hypothetical protein
MGIAPYSLDDESWKIVPNIETFEKMWRIFFITTRTKCVEYYQGIGEN